MSPAPRGDPEAGKSACVLGRCMQQAKENVYYIYIPLPSTPSNPAGLVENGQSSLGIVIAAGLGASKGRRTGNFACFAAGFPTLAGTARRPVKNQGLLRHL